MLRFSEAAPITPAHFAASRSAERSGTRASTSDVMAAGKRWPCNRRLYSDAGVVRCGALGHERYLHVSGGSLRHRSGLRRYLPDAGRTAARDGLDRPPRDRPRARWAAPRLDPTAPPADALARAR